MAEGSEVIRFAIFAIALVLAAPTGAQQPALKNAVVKVVSSVTSDSVVLRGSGLAFQHGGKGYVLTSDHVVLHDDDGKEHVVYGDKIPATPCDFVISDYGRGLALLKAVSPARLEDWPRWEDLLWRAPQPGDRVAMMGFPAMAEGGLVRDLAGKVSDAAKPWDALVQVRHMIEVKGGHAEFGMSGGVVASPGDTLFGLLSHQVYSPPNGSPSANTILAIPGALIVDWVSRVLASPGDPASYPIELFQTSEQLRWAHGPAYLTSTLIMGWTDAFGTGRRVMYISRASRPAPGKIFGGETGDLAKIRDFFKKRDDCLLYVLRFQTRSPRFMAAAHVSTMRAFEDASLQAVLHVRCNDGSRDTTADRL